jgi:long-chain fatty acid transport protein
MNQRVKRVVGMGVLAGLVVPGSVFATNGMNLEGYGPIALGMGGASMAYDNGTAAVMNNPATLGLMAQGHRLDVALGFLGPDVTASMEGQPDAKSSADAFYMPAIGWVMKQNQLSFGVGVFAQGGMGTEYAADSFMAAGTGEKVRSEVSSLGGSQTLGTASGTMVDGLVANIGPNKLLDPNGPVNTARFDFSNDSDFTGEASGTGFGGKLGVVYKVNKQFTIGATYHSKTAISDLETKNATVTMDANVDDGIAGGGTPTNTYSSQTIAVTGDLKVKDFQWPATFGIGAAFQATDKLMFALDVKRIQWSDTMKDFKMQFTADPTADQTGFAQGFGDAKLDAVLFQNWDDQTVIEFGGAYQIDDAWTVRAGFNHGSNPIPDEYLNALFPAIVENHITAGVGYQINEPSSINFALSRASEISATNPNTGVTSKHSQLSWQLMYTYLY